MELSEKVRKGGGDNAIARHTQRNRKLLVRDRLRLLLDDEDFLELSPFAGLGLPYGDIPSAGCPTGQKLLTRRIYFWYKLDCEANCLQRTLLTPLLLFQMPSNQYSHASCLCLCVLYVFVCIFIQVLAGSMACGVFSSPMMPQ